MSLSSIFRVMVCLGLLFCACVSSQAQGSVIPYSNLPLLTATAEAPKTVKKSTIFTYAVSVTDADDYWSQGQGHIQMPDITSKVHANAINSMTNITWSFRGQTGSMFTYDVVGKSLTTTGVYRDSFLGYNDRSPEADRLYDSGLAFAQTVIIND